MQNSRAQSDGNNLRGDVNYDSSDEDTTNVPNETTRDIKETSNRDKNRNEEAGVEEGFDSDYSESDYEVHQEVDGVDNKDQVQIETDIAKLHVQEKSCKNADKL